MRTSGVPAVERKWRDGKIVLWLLRRAQNSCRTVASEGEIRPGFGRNWPIWANALPNLTNVWQSSTNIGRLGPRELADVGRRLPNVSRMLVKVGSNSAESGPDLGHRSNSSTLFEPAAVANNSAMVFV